MADARKMRPTAVERQCNYTRRFDIQVTDSNKIYIGLASTSIATSSALWQIRRVTLASNVPNAIEWADGNQVFDNVWDDRDSLSYS